MKTLPLLFVALALAACQSPANGSAENAATQDSQATPAAAPGATGVTPQVTEIASGLEHPWSVALLPDGGFLVTEREGRLRRIAADGTVSAPIAGAPEVFAQGQGGLLDVVLAPDFDSSRRVYLSYAEPGEVGTAGTAVA